MLTVDFVPHASFNFQFIANILTLLVGDWKGTEPSDISTPCRSQGCK